MDDTQGIPRGERSAVEPWTAARVPFKFGVGDFVVFSIRLRLLARNADTAEPPLSSGDLANLAFPDDRSVSGALVRSHPVAETLPKIVRSGRHIAYAFRQYHRYYVNLTLGWDAYLARFSARTRGTIQRKVKKFAAMSGGACDWRCYRREAEMAEFHRLARQVSLKTYQEKLLDAGLPEGEAFLARIGAMAAADVVLGYLLFADGKPVSYLLLPVEDGKRIVYAYVGFDPAYRAQSPGTVLLWLRARGDAARGALSNLRFHRGRGRAQAAHGDRVPAMRRHLHSQEKRGDVMSRARPRGGGLVFVGHRQDHGATWPEATAAAVAPGAIGALRTVRPMGALLDRVSYAWRRHGAFGFARLVVYNFGHVLRKGLGAARGTSKRDQFDASHGTDTGGIRELGTLGIRSPNARYAVRYQPSNYDQASAAIRSLAIDPAEFSFVDFGSGKGRVLLAAARFPFQAVVGVEFSPSLHAIAEENLAKILPGQIRAKTVRSVQIDAVQFELPKSNLVCYLYNPFEPPVLTEVVRRLAEHHRRHGFRVIVIYVDPRHRDVLLQFRSLRVDRESAQMIIAST